MRKEKYLQIFTELEAVAKVQSIKSSNAIEGIVTSDEHIDFKQHDILRLHEIMLSVVSYEFGGKYKSNDNVILEVDTTGNRRVRFRPTSAKEMGA